MIIVVAGIASTKTELLAMDATAGTTSVEQTLSVIAKKHTRLQ